MITLAGTIDSTWQPGLGDPTIMGWLTVVAYFTAAAFCGLCARRLIHMQRRDQRPTDAWLWGILTAVMLILGANKQLDLQSLITTIGRDVAKEQGWYDNRKIVQRIFIAAVALGGGAVIAGLVYQLRRRWRSYLVTLTGITVLGCFIIIRATSFHHVDHWLRWDLGSLRLNWAFELTGIALVGGSACWHWRRVRPIERIETERPEA